MDDVGALARSIEGHRRRREDVPVVTGITVEEDGPGLHGSQDVIHVHRDPRTLEEMDMAVDAATGDSRPEEEVPWDAGTGDRAGRQQQEDYPETDTYMEDDSEQGLNYDSVFVPEEPKRVVTASGKVIETETELLKKKIEKKKELSLIHI